MKFLKFNQVLPVGLDEIFCRKSSRNFFRWNVNVLLDRLIRSLCCCCCCRCCCRVGVCVCVEEKERRWGHVSHTPRVGRILLLFLQKSPRWDLMWPRVPPVGLTTRNALNQLKKRIKRKDLSFLLDLVFIHPLHLQLLIL